MTVEASSEVEFPDPARFGLAVVDEEDLAPELHHLAGQVRLLAEAVAHTQADPERLRAAGDTVGELVRRLSGRRRDTRTMLRRTEDGRDRYGTLTNVVSGPVNPAAPPLKMADAEDGVVGECTLNATYQGPPGLVHGGWIAALLDQALGEAVGAAGVPALTANLQVNYRKPTPLGVPLQITARITGTERRKVFVTGQIRHGGETTAEATAVMVRLAHLL